MKKYKNCNYWAKKCIDFFIMHQTVLFYNFPYEDNNNTGFNIMSSYTLKQSQNLTASCKNEMSKAIQASRSNEIGECIGLFLKKYYYYRQCNAIKSTALLKPYFSKLHIFFVVHDDILMNIYTATWYILNIIFAECFIYSSF